MPPWIREGDCPPERCQGRCCTHTGIWFMDASDQIKAFLQTQEVRGMRVGRIDGDYLLDIPQVCQYLTYNGLCALHPDMKPGPDLPSRPDFCEQWPTEPSQLISDPNCGFSFRWEDEPIGATNG